MEIKLSAKNIKAHADGPDGWIKIIIDDLDVGQFYDVIAEMDLFDLVNEIGVDVFLDAIGLDAAKKRFELIELSRINEYRDGIGHELKDVRQYRGNGEVAQSDRAEIKLLITQLLRVLPGWRSEDGEVGFARERCQFNREKDSRCYSCGLGVLRSLRVDCPYAKQIIDDEVTIKIMAAQIDSLCKEREEKDERKATGGQEDER